MKEWGVILLAALTCCLCSYAKAVPNTLVYLSLSDTTHPHSQDSTSVHSDSSDQWHVDTVSGWYPNTVTLQNNDQSDEDTSVPVSLLESKISLGLSFGIDAISAQDVVNFINQEMNYTAITPHTFATSAGLSSSLTYRVSQSLDAAFEYSFITNSYTFGDYNNLTDYSYDLHTFGVAIHRLFNHEDYGIAAGAGAGALLGFFRQTLPSSNTTQFSSAAGETMFAEMILRAAFSNHLYLHTEFHGFVIFSGSLKSGGVPLTYVSSTTPPISTGVTFNSFGGSLNIGLDYFF